MGNVISILFFYEFIIVYFFSRFCNFNLFIFFYVARGLHELEYKLMWEIVEGKNEVMLGADKMLVSC